MLKDVIGEILEAEKKADETLKNAEAECRSIVERAGEKADSLVKSAAAEASGQTQRIIKEAKEDTEKRIKDHEKALEESLVLSSGISAEAAERACSEVLSLIMTTLVSREE